MSTEENAAFLKANALFVYIIFLIHMLGFGLLGFYLAYGKPYTNIIELYLIGGFAIYIYIWFYIGLFGLDTVKWIFINSLLGLFGIYAQRDWALSLFGKSASDYSIFVHVIPFTFYILYTFLIRRALLDLTNCIGDCKKKKVVEMLYIAISIAVYSVLSFV